MTAWSENPDRFIRECLQALGGAQGLKNVQTIKLDIARRTVAPDGSFADALVTVHRAAGGHIRIDERVGDHITATVVNGLVGQRLTLDGSKDGRTVRVARPMAAAEVMDIKRDIRLYPRNFLAHADEHLFDAPVDGESEGRRVIFLDLPREDVRYGFDAETFLCLFVEDRMRGVTTRYEDYRPVAGISTPHLERRFRRSKLEREDRLESVAYNLPFEKGLFEFIDEME